MSKFTEAFNESQNRLKNTKRTNTPVDQKQQTKIGFIFMFIVLVSLIGYCNYSSEPETPLTQEQIHQKELEKNFSAFDGSHRKVVRATKEKMNDPSSFEHISTTYIERPNSLLVTMKFRGKNAFGALVQQQVLADADKKTGEVLSIELR